MRTNRWSAAWVMCLVLASGANADDGDPLARFQQALQREEGAGDASGALAIYEALATDSAAPAALRARALVRAGACHTRLGDLDAARRAYGRALALDAPAEVKAEAQAQLAGLEAAAAPPPSRGTVELLPGAPGDEPRVRVMVVDADIRWLLIELARAARLGLVVSPQVRGSCTVTLDGVAPRAALESIVRATGAYEVVSEPGGRLLRVGGRESFEQQLQVRSFRLRQRAPGPETARARRLLLDQVSALLRSAAILGQWAGYDPQLQLLLVRAAATSWPAIELLVEGEREAVAAPGAPSEPGTFVSAEFEDANVRTVLRDLALFVNHPLLVAPEVRGTVSVLARGVPVTELLDAVLATTGDYVRVSTPAGDVAVSRDRAEGWLELEVWPLRLTPAEVWGGPWTRPVEGRRLRAHLERLGDDLSRALAVSGCLVALDPVANALVVRLPVHQAAELRRVLAAAGCVAPADVRAGTELRDVPESTSIRAVIGEEARAAGSNVIVGPDVRGEVGDGTFARGAPLEATLRLLVRSTGDYEVFASEQDMLRVTRRDSAEQQLATGRLALRERTGDKGVTLGAILADVVTLSAVQGALVLHQPEGNFVLATLPRPLLAQVEAAVTVLDRVVLAAPLLVVGTDRPNGTLCAWVHAVGPEHAWLKLQAGHPLLAELSVGGERTIGRGVPYWMESPFPDAVQLGERTIFVWQ